MPVWVWVHLFGLFYFILLFLEGRGWLAKLCKHWSSVAVLLEGEDRDGGTGGSGSSAVNHVRVVLDLRSPKISCSCHPFCSGVWARLSASIRQTLLSPTICSAPSCPDSSCSLWCWLIPTSACREGSWCPSSGL